MMKWTVIPLVFLIASLGVLATEANESTSVLIEKIRQVVFPEPLVPSGKSSEQQFLSVLEQISDGYSRRWSEPLPIAIDLVAIRHLRNHGEALPSSIGLVLKDAPLEETLRSWCMRAELEMTFTSSRIVITTRKK